MYIYSCGIRCIRVERRGFLERQRERAAVHEYTYANERARIDVNTRMARGQLTFITLTLMDYLIPYTPSPSSYTVGGCCCSGQQHPFTYIYVYSYSLLSRSIRGRRTAAAALSAILSLALSLCSIPKYSIIFMSARKLMHQGARRSNRG